MAKRTKNNRARTRTRRRTNLKKINRASRKKRMNKTKKRNNKKKVKSGGGGVYDIRIKPFFNIEDDKNSDQIVFGINPNIAALLKCFTDDLNIMNMLVDRFGKDSLYLPFYTTEDILISLDETKEVLFIAQTIPLKIYGNIMSSDKFYKIKIDDLNSDLAIQNIIDALTVLNQGQTGGYFEALKSAASSIRNKMSEKTSGAREAFSKKTSEIGQKIKGFSLKRSLGDLVITLVKHLTGKYRKGVHEISFFITKEAGIYKLKISIVLPSGEEVTAVLLESRGKYKEIKTVLEQREELLMAISIAAIPETIDLVSEKTEKACIKDEKNGFQGNEELEKVLSETSELSNYIGEIKGETQSLSPPPVSEPVPPPPQELGDPEPAPEPPQAPPPHSLEAVAEIVNQSSSSEIQDDTARKAEEAAQTARVAQEKWQALREDCIQRRGCNTTKTLPGRKQGCRRKCDEEASRNVQLPQNSQ